MSWGQDNAFIAFDEEYFSKSLLDGLMKWTAKKTSFILLVILAAASALRLWKLGIIPGTFGDEIVYFLTAKKMFFGTFPLMLHSAHGTLIAFLMALSSRIFGLTVFALRLPVALMGIATVGIFYFLGKRLFNEKVGLLASLLVAVSPWHVGYSRVAWISASTLFFSSLFLLLVLRGIEKRQKLAFFLGGLALGMSFHDHQYAGFIMLIVAGVYAIFLRKISLAKIVKGRYFWIMVVGFLLPVIPLVYHNMTHDFVTIQYFFGHQTHTLFGEVSMSSASPLEAIGSRYLSLANTMRYSLQGNNIMVNYWIHDSLPVWLWLFVIALLLIIYLSFAQNPGRRQSRLLLMGLVVSALVVPFFAGYGNHAIYGFISSSHYMEPLFLFVFLIMAAGIVFVSEKICSLVKRRDFLTVVIAIGLSALSLSFLAVGYFFALEKNCPDKEYNPTLLQAVDLVGEQIKGRAVVADDFNFGEFLSSEKVAYYYYDNAKNYYDFNVSLPEWGDKNETLDLFFLFSPYRDELTGTRGKNPNLKLFEQVNPGLKPMVIPSCSGGDVTIFHIPTFVRKYQNVRFDFGDFSSPLAEGYERVSQATPYTPILGYGWDWTITDPAGLRLNTKRAFNPDDFKEFNEYGWHFIPVRNATQFYSAGINDSLLADGFVLFADSTFKTDVPNGRYKIEAVMATGEAENGKPTIRILTEGGVIEHEAEANKLQRLLFEIGVQDGQLNLLFQPVNSNLIIFALSIDKI